MFLITVITKTLRRREAPSEDESSGQSGAEGRIAGCSHAHDGWMDAEEATARLNKQQVGNELAQ